MFSWHHFATCSACSWQVGQRYGLPLLSPVDDAGLFTAEAGEDLQGLAVLDEGNAAVIAKLQAVDALLKVRQPV